MKKATGVYVTRQVSKNVKERKENHETEADSVMPHSTNNNIQKA